MNLDGIVYQVGPTVSNEEPNELFDADSPDTRGFVLVLYCGLGFAYHEQSLVGFANLAWDGGAHAFLLDTTVHPGLRRCGIGKRLVWEAAGVARGRGVEWLQVDFDPTLRVFYRRCDFRRTEAGPMRHLWKGYGIRLIGSIAGVPPRAGGSPILRRSRASGNPQEAQSSAGEKRSNGCCMKRAAAIPC